MAQQEGFSPDILKVCREVLDHLKNDPSGRPKKQLLVVELETALDAASGEIHKAKDIEKHDSPYFGQLGKHYDLTLTVERAHRRNYGYRMVCIDWEGRHYVVRAKNDAIPFLIRPGMHLFFRGEVIKKQRLDATPHTFIAVVSGLKEVTPRSVPFRDHL